MKINEAGKKMKIVLISDHYPAFPGQASPNISYAIHAFARQWARTGHVLVIRPWVLSGRKWRPPLFLKKSFVLDGVKVVLCPVVKLPFQPIFWLRGLFRIIKKEIDADVVVAHLGFNLIFGYKTAKRFDLPFVAAVHDGDLLRFGPKMLTVKLMRKIYGYAAGIACRSFALYSYFVKWAPELSDKCFVAYSGVNADILIPRDAAMRRFKDKEKKDSIRLISVCHLIDRKHIDVVLLALHALGRQTDWIYEIVGKGPAESRLHQLTKSLGLCDRVHFKGYLAKQEVQNILERSQIFVMVSSNETFGLAYLEAMAAGNIVIAGKGTGVDGIIEDGVNGFLCIPGDADDLSEKLQHICFEITTNDRLDIVKKSLATIQEYTEEKAADNYMQILQQAIECGGGIS